MVSHHSLLSNWPNSAITACLVQWLDYVCPWYSCACVCVCAVPPVWLTSLAVAVWQIERHLVLVKAFRTLRSLAHFPHWSYMRRQRDRVRKSIKKEVKLLSLSWHFCQVGYTCSHFAKWQYSVQTAINVLSMTPFCWRNITFWLTSCMGIHAYKFITAKYLGQNCMQVAKPPTCLNKCFNMVMFFNLEAILGFFKILSCQISCTEIFKIPVSWPLLRSLF